MILIKPQHTPIEFIMFDLGENSFGVHFHHSYSNECEEMCVRDVTIMVHPEGNKSPYQFSFS